MNIPPLQPNLISLDISNYSSLLELLCGYHLVSAISGNESQLAKALNFAKPIDNNIDLVTQKLVENFKELDPKKPNGIRDIVQYDKDEKLFKKLKLAKLNHKTKAPNLYLVGGLLAFWLLLWGAIGNDFRKENSGMLLVLGSAMLYLMFISCEFSTSKLLKRILVSLGLLTILFAVLEIGWHVCSFMDSRDRTWWLVGTLTIFMTVIVIRPQLIAFRTMPKSIFILIFFAPIMIYDSSTLYQNYYPTDDLGAKQWQVTTSLLLLLAVMFPFIYDVMVLQRLFRRFQSLHRGMNKSQQRKYTVQGGNVELSKEIRADGTIADEKENIPSA